MIRGRTAPLIFALALRLSAQITDGSANPIVFDERILPALQKNCATCHALSNPAGGLSVANFDAVLAGGKHGPAITPGNSKESLLVQYLRGERTPKMPMGGVLSDDVVASLAKAIDEMQ